MSVGLLLVPLASSVREGKYYIPPRIAGKISEGMWKQAL
jgi:hypothetical protein